MHIARAKAFTRTLRFRLMVWNAFVVIITAAVTLIGLREGVRITLVHELDQLLDEDLKEIQLSLAEFGDPTAEALREQLDRKAQGHAQHGWFAQILDNQGRPLASSPNVPPTPKLRQSLAGSTPQTVDQWRVLEARSNRDPQVTILIGSSLRLIQQDVARLDRLVGIATGTILLTAPACGYWLAGRATRPLAQIISTMSKLRPDQLHERLPLRQSGDELDQLSITFNRLLDRIGTYVQERRDFLANSAHELRTPLAAIRSSVEVTLGSDRTLGEYEELLNQIIEESSALELLVNQLLLLAETERERLNPYNEDVRLDELLTKAMDMFEGVCEFREIELVAGQLVPAIVKGNRQHLRQVVLNLLDNAIKFTPSGGAVRLSLQLDEPSREVVFQIEDSGSGITPQDLPHVFDRFFRGDKGRGRDTPTRGTGLGLSICQAIVHAHQGEITIESEPGVGTRVTVRLPVHASSATADLPITQESQR